MKTRCLLLAVSALVLPAFSAEYLGASKFLQRLAAEPDAAPAKKSEQQVWRDHVKDYKQAAAELGAKEAASRWLGLFDEWLALPASEPMAYFGSGAQGPSFALLAALPPPKAWSELSEAITARPAGGKGAALQPTLRMLAAALSNDYGTVATELKGARKVSAKGSDVSFRNDGFRGLNEWLAALKDNPKEVIAALEEKIAAAERGEAPGSIEVPDLVTLIGPQQSETLLRRLLRTPGIDLQVPVGDATRALAVTLATKLIAELKKPHWSLLVGLSPAEAALYEAFDKRFPRKEDEDQRDWQRSEVDRLHLYALIAAHRTAEAVTFATALAERSGPEQTYSRSGLDTLVRAGLPEQVQAFFHELLEKDPALPFWEEYIGVAAKTGQAPAAVAFMRAIESRPGLAPATRQTIESHLWTALLAADEVAEGVKLLQQFLTAKVADLQQAPAAAPRRRQMSFGRDDGPSKVVELGLKLCSLGQLLKRPELIEEGIAAAKVGYKAASSSPNSYVGNELVTRLVELERGPEAEELILYSSLQAAKRAKETHQNSYGTEQNLIALATIYHRAGRWADVLTLLSDAEGWGVGDLKNILTSSVIERLPLGYVAASALVSGGRKEEARKVLVALLEEEGGFDPAYELLLQLDGAGAIPTLDRLAGRDRFEERPLIWKARLQFDAGALAEAEQTIRAAITIDPSDGEQGKGTRMRAYAVLGDILEKRGDAAQAKTMRGAVEAIRLSENADDWWQAGLLSRSVKMYEEALGHFADAYCIQSRLALRYAELGDQVKAEEHYRRAYELMPESFGRVESHCFGCEGSFSGERAQGIAEQVFTRLTQTMPHKPQVFYLLGYLRGEEGKYQDAAAQYRIAVELDPDYLNAWIKLSEVGQRVALPKAERERAALAALRLDPLHRHEGHSSSSAYRFGGVGGLYVEIFDLRALWKVLATSADLLAGREGDLLPLQATRTEIQRSQKAGREGDQTDSTFDMESYLQGRGRSGAHYTAGDALAQHIFLTHLAHIMQTQVSQ